jgi:hypothetical protein
MRLSRPSTALIVTLTALSLSAPATAAQRRPAAEPAASGRSGAADARREASATASSMTAEETRRALEELLRQYPPSLPRILRLDPSLLGNPGYLQPYPALAAFLTEHPEVGHNPGYFFAEYEGNYGDRVRVVTAQERALEMWREAIQGFTIGTVLLALGAGVIWLIRTLIEHRRWSRLSKIQTEVHNKLMDRFTANEDLLAYIQTPAGKRFLESAPIPLDSPRAINAPLGRILWSAQAGTVLTVLGLGVAVVASRSLEEVAAPLAAFGVVIIALGLGFIISAFLAYALTRRFGLLAEANASPETRG